MNPRLIAALVLGLIAFAPSLSAQATRLQTDSEASLTPRQTAPTWKLAAFPARSTTSIGYRELPVRRLLDLQHRNASQRIKATQIGIGRTLVGEGMQRTTPALRWIPLKTGGAVARLQVSSPDALALRVGLQVRMLHPHVELRFAGQDAASQVVAMVTAADAARSADGSGIYWTPATDGPGQIIELYRPAHVAASQVRVQAPLLSHLVSNSRNDFKLIEKVGESGSCNINAMCKVAQLGPAYVQAKNAVAHMVFVENGASYICTGTLLNDTVAATQVPYFYSAAHCIDNQTVASTLNTYWAYENSACGTLDAQRHSPLTGGADLLFSDATTDALLLRLRNPAPAGATFAGWDASPLAANAEIIGIHHPSGDAKKVSVGRHVSDTYPQQFTVGWQEGTTEGGSSGSGLFALYADNTYRLRGGLYGGNASCSNTGSLTNTANRDHYSRLDLIFPQIKQWLASEPVRENGSQALVRTAGAVAQGQGTRTAQTAPTPAPVQSTPSERQSVRRVSRGRSGVLDR